MTIQRKKIVNYLFAAAIILLVVNTIIEYKERPPKKKAVNELSVSQIENVFFKVLDEYGIEPDWISKKKYKASEYDSVKVEYFVKLPADLPVPLIIKDINNVIEKDITSLVAEEKKFYGTTEIRIYTNEALKLKATLIPDKENIRKGNKLAFIISDAFDLSDKDFKNFLSNYLPIAAEIIPDKNNTAQADTINKYSKEFAVLLNNDISDNDMKLRPDYTKPLLYGSIRNIVTAFGSDHIYIVDDKADILRSHIYKYIKAVFSDMRVRLHQQSEFVSLDTTDPAQLYADFSKVCSDTSGSNQKLFILPYENFVKLIDTIEKYKKKGNKIIPVSQTYLFKN